MRHEDTRSLMAGEDDRYRLLIDASTDCAIYMLDAAGMVTGWNAGAERLKGYAAAEILGRHFSVFYRPEDVASGKPAETLRHAREVGRFEADDWRRRADGSIFLARVVVEPIVSETGAVVGFAKVTRDLSGELETRARLDAAQHELALSQKVEALGQVSAGIAHDFNNVLSVVLGNLELLKGRLPGDDLRAQRFVTNACAGARQGAALVKRLSAIGRRRSFDLEAIALDPVIAELVDLMRHSIPGDIRLDLDLDDDLDAVVVDRTQFEAMVLNLVFNARDAISDPGLITIGARSHCASAAGAPMVAFFVADTGCGMDAATLSKAMEPFFSTKPCGKGTGLGLAMAKRFAECVGGEIDITSVPGEGTTVTVLLPVAAADVMTPSAPEPQSPRALAGASAGY